MTEAAQHCVPADVAPLALRNAAERDRWAAITHEENSVDIHALIESLTTGQHETYPPATEQDIKTTEQAIGYALPYSFKAFLQGFSNGAYLYLLQEVSAVGVGNPQILPIQDIEWLKGEPSERIPIREGGETRLGNLIPFGLDANGNAWCFVTDLQSENGEYVVYYFNTSGRKLYSKIESFARWLEILTDKQDEVIRTLYDDAVLSEELNLG